MSIKPGEFQHTIATRLNNPGYQRELQLARSLADVRDGIAIWQQQGATAEADGGRLWSEELDELNLLIGQEDDLMEQLPGEPEDLLDLDVSLHDELSDLTNANVELQQAVEPGWLVEQIGPMPTDERLRDIWVTASEALYGHRASHGIHGHADPTVPSMPTPLRALLRRSRTELGH